MLSADSDLLFAVGATLLTRDPANVLTYRNGGPADLLSMVAYLFLAFGVLHVPLDTPLFDPDEA